MSDEVMAPHIGLIETRAFIKDENKRYLYCNRAYASDLGMEPVGMIGKDDFFFYPAYLADIYRFDDSRVLEKGLFFEGQEMYLVSGYEYWAHTVKVPFFGIDGNTAGIFGVIAVAEPCLPRKTLLEKQLEDLYLMISAIPGYDEALTTAVYKSIYPLADKMCRIPRDDQKDILIHIRDALY